MKLSVGLPFYRSKYIGWLALESLCRQEDIDFEWELVIIEEHKNKEAMGEKEIRSYEPRLRSIGCARFDYIPIEKWIPLGVKLGKLIGRFSDTEVAIWNPDDYYAPAKLLNNAYNTLKHNTDVDWYSIPKTIFYNISDEKTIVYDVLSAKGRRWDDSTGRAFRTKILKSAANQFDKRTHSCDGMVRDSYKKALTREIVPYFDKTDIWKYGLNTKGFNNICIWHYIHFLGKPEPPFFECTVDINKTIPNFVIERLKNCKKYLSLHKKSR